MSATSQTPTNWTPEQKRELAIKLVEGFQSADPQMQMQFDSAIAREFPDRILEKLESLPAANTQPGQLIRGSVAMGLANDRPQEGLRILDELPDGVLKLMMMVQFESVVQLDEDARLQLLARIVQDARGIKEAEYRVVTLGFAAEQLLDRGQRESGELLLRETLNDAKNLAPAAWLYPSTMAAALCKHTAELAPNQLSHRIWQTMALRRPMEKSGPYNLPGIGCCCQMALLLARVDRNQVPTGSHVGCRVHRMAAVTSQPMSVSRVPAASLIAELQPEQCEAALDAVTDEASKDRLRLGLVKALTRTGDTRDRAVRQSMMLWFPDDEDHGPID